MFDQDAINSIMYLATISVAAGVFFGLLARDVYCFIVRTLFVGASYVRLKPKKELMDSRKPKEE